MKRLAPYLAALCVAPPAMALDLAFSGPAKQTHFETENFASYKLPIGPFQDGAIATLVAEGPRVQTAWTVQSSSGTTLGVADNLRQQIEAVGFELLYECETQECGGFDFRFETEVLPEPDMHIDLGDYRYLAAQRLGGAVPEYLSLFVSRSDTLGYVQMILIGGAEAEPVAVTTTTQTSVAPAGPKTQLAPLTERLETRGSAVLEDLQFETGSSALQDKSYDTLNVLAAYLIGNPNRTIALVGHTDSEGSLQGNIGLSRKRAQAVAQRLTSALGVPAAQVEAEGVGYLAPVASNLSEEGRTQNRRVEVILTSTQ